MKRILFIIALIFVATAKSFAQSPIITDFRQIVTERATGFKNIQQELLMDNTEKGVKIYQSSVGGSSICKSLVTHSATDGDVLLMIFNIESMDAMTMKIFMNIAQQYVTELNDMVKTGNYKGRDYKEGDDSITEITDIDGKVVVQYISNPTDHMLMFFGA